MFGKDNKKDSKKDDKINEENNNKNLEDLEKEIENLENSEKQEEKQENKDGENSFEEKFNSLNDKYLRSMAEFENFRRRTTDEKIENFRIGGKQVLSSVIPFLDNFKRAVDSCDEKLKKDDWVKGILAIEDNLIGDLEKIGFKKIKAKGEKFDFKKHEALMQDANVEKDIISQVLEDGYEYNGAVVRHVKVSVGSK